MIAKSLQAIEIAPLDAIEIAVEPWTWPFAQARRADMDCHFAARRRERPALWNGRVLLHRYARENGVLRGASFETDYASFLAWRETGVVPRPACSMSSLTRHCNRPTSPFRWAKWRRYAPARTTPTTKSKYPDCYIADTGLTAKTWVNSFLSSDGSMATTN